MSFNVGVIDYGAGNLRSVYNTFSSIGVEPVMISSPEQLEGITHLVLPGVGSFGDCARKLREQDLEQAIKDWISEDKPFLGICVGYQILFERGEEDLDVPGLGIFKGKVVKFRTDGTDLKVPHMGWNEVSIHDAEDPIWEGIGGNPYFYFVHSYYPEVEDASLIAGVCHYGIDFAAAIRRGNLLATQFHPEKSQKLGALLLSNFIK